jgi:hypothetical protein
VLGGLMGRAETENAILRSLTRVGPAKPVTYLPLHTIRIILQMDPQALAQDAELNGLGAALFGPDDAASRVAHSTSSTGNHSRI